VPAGSNITQAQMLATPLDVTTHQENSVSATNQISKEATQAH
jgi:hypothetical protein